jgi:hypothetical protein
MLVVLTQVPRKADRYEPAALELADHISSRKLPLSGPVFLINAQKNTFSGTPQHGLDELLDETFRIAPESVPSLPSCREAPAHSVITGLSEGGDGDISSR